MASLPPRVVTVTRPSELEQLVARHGTAGQARFFLAARGQSIEVLDERHERLRAALTTVSNAIPAAWRRARVSRPDLSRFLFEPQDIILAVGQDGLVANVAKYLAGQPVIGVNPDPLEYQGILVPHGADQVARLLEACAGDRHRLQARTMIAAAVDDGQHLLALNEVFVGHRTHQSARYRLCWEREIERQSSSGLIVASGTGATGWALSIHRQRRHRLPLPEPEESRLVFFVREPFPSVATGCGLAEGEFGEGAALKVISEMNEDGVIFGDGIEDDRLTFGWGQTASFRVARQRLHLVVADR